MVASVVQDIAHIVALEDVDRADFEAHQELDDDKDLEEFDTAGLVVVGHKLEDNQVDRVDFVVDTLREHYIVSSETTRNENSYLDSEDSLVAVDTVVVKLVACFVVLVVVEGHLVGQ